MKKYRWVVLVSALLALPLIAYSVVVLIQRSELKSLALRDLPGSLKQSKLIAVTYDSGFFEGCVGR